MIIDYNALIARRKAQGLPSLFGDSDTDGDSINLGLRTLLPELREEKFRNRGSKVERELSHGRITNNEVSSESETAEEATIEGFVSDTRNRRMTPSLIINNSTRSPFLTSGSDQEALATSASGARKGKSKGDYSNGNGRNPDVVASTRVDDRHKSNAVDRKDNSNIPDVSEELSTTQSGRIPSSSSPAHSSSGSSMTTSSSDSREEIDDSAEIRNSVIGEGGPRLSHKLIDQNELTPQERHYLNKALVS